MITAKDIMRDQDVAKMLGISADVFQRRMKHGFKPGELDFTAIALDVCGVRRFFREDVERVIRERIVVREGDAQ